MLASCVPQTAVALSPTGTLARNLLVARTVADLSQQQLAEAAGVSRATIAQIEAGATDPRLSTIVLLAAALQVPTTLLLFGAGEFDAMIRLAGPATYQPALPPHRSALLAHLAASSSPHNLLTVAQIAIEYAAESGLDAPSAQLGAALAAVHGAGPQMLAGARFAQDLSSKGG